MVLVSMFGGLMAQQDTTKIRVLGKNVILVEEDSVGTKVKVGKNGGIQVIANHEGDTVSIRIGNRVFDVMERDGKTEITTTKRPRDYRPFEQRMFNGHWAGFEMGINSFHSHDYSLYKNTPYELYGEFFDLNYGKSLTVNLNFAEFAFSNDRKTVALVTGLGFSFMDFRFDQHITIAKEAATGRIIPIDLPADIKKSKLNVSYLTAPLILEIATPLKLHHQKMTIGGGVIAGINIGSHTKIKYDNNSKDKARGNFNLNPFKYDLTGRLGLGEFCLFANYGMTPLFKDGKGPGLKTLVIGVSFPNVSF